VATDRGEELPDSFRRHGTNATGCIWYLSEDDHKLRRKDPRSMNRKDVCKIALYLISLMRRVASIHIEEARLETQQLLKKEKHLFAGFWSQGLVTQLYRCLKAEARFRENHLQDETLNVIFSLRRLDVNSSFDASSGVPLNHSGGARTMVVDVSGCASAREQYCALHIGQINAMMNGEIVI
jgi:hypothetical protein